MQTPPTFTIADGASLTGSRSLFEGVPGEDLGLFETLGAELYELHETYQATRGFFGRGSQPPAPIESDLYMVRGNKVVVSFKAIDGEDEALLSTLERFGFEGSAYGGGVSGQLPLWALGFLDRIEGIAGVAPTIAETRVGSVTSQADPGLNADDARTAFGVDGTGITVGVLSDSYNTSPTATTSEADDIASGDLPNDVQVLLDLPAANGGIDEGRAMMQLIHDLAPGADLQFRTAFLGPEDFAAGILELANAGADIIVDDIGYLAQPQLQDGVIAQAVDEVRALGIPYFSSAGNSGSQAYESEDFGPGDATQQTFVVDFGGGSVATYEAHDFDPGAGVDIRQGFTLNNNESIRIALQWDDPYNAPVTDLDIFVFDPATNSIVSGAANDNLATGGIAVEFFSFANTTGAAKTYELVIGQFDAGNDPFNVPDPGLVRYIDFNGGTSDAEFFTNSGTVFGHPRAEGGAGVGASAYFNTPEFGVSPALLNSFSSVGGIPIIFDKDGNRLPAPELRQDVSFVSIDGADTTFFGSDFDSNGFPNFFGTSAAAPHAAAVAALMLDANPNLTPAEVFQILSDTALEMHGPGIDPETGAGLIQADLAVAAAVAALNTEPVAVNDDYTTDEDVTLVVGVANGVLDNDTDDDGDTLTASLVSDVSNGTLTLNDDGSFSYAPDPDFFGTDSFTYQAADGNDGFATADVTITVNPVNDEPVAVNDEYATDEDVTLVVGVANGVLDNDTDDDGDTLTASVVSDVSNGTLTLNDDGSFSYAPDPDFFGTDGFIYEVNDGNTGTNTASVLLTVNAVNDPPSVLGETGVEAYATDEDTTLNIGAAAGVLANDFDVDLDPLTATLQTGPSSGSLTFNDDGSFIYAPDPDFFGTDSFTYTVSDLTVSSGPVTAEIVVAPVNDPPVAINDSYSTPFETALTVPAPGVLQNDEDPENDDLDATVLTQPANGSLSLDFETGAFTYTPDAGFSGTDSFVYEADDGNGGTNDATVSIEVAPQDLNVITGTNGIDRLFGTSGNDLFDPLAGTVDIMFGNGGEDLFDFSSSTANGLVETRVIGDFAPGDTLDLGGVAIASEVPLTGSLLLFLEGDGDVVRLNGVTELEADALV